MKACSFDIYINDDVFTVFCTPMCFADGKVVIDFWCPDNPLFNTRTSFDYCKNIIESLTNHIIILAEKNNLQIKELHLHP